VGEDENRLSPFLPAPSKSTQSRADVGRCGQFSSQEAEVVGRDGIRVGAVDAQQGDRVGADAHLRVGTEIRDDHCGGEIVGIDPEPARINRS
jgi:hypothetical protein